MDKVYVVFEDDRGLSVSIVGVYANEEVAREIAMQSPLYFCQPATFHGGWINRKPAPEGENEI
jgi:hypothetical protein